MPLAGVDNRGFRGRIQRRRTLVAQVFGLADARTGTPEFNPSFVDRARYFVKVIRLEKRACPKCSNVEAAPLAERIVEKGLASDVLVIRKRLVNRGPGRYWMCGIGGLLKLEQGKSPVASCGEAIRSAG